MQYSIVSFKKVMSASKGARIDANFFHPDFINNEKLVNKKNKIHSFVEKNISKLEKAPNYKFNYLEISNISTNSLSYRVSEIDPAISIVPSRATYKLQDKDVVVSTVRPNRNAVAIISNSNNLVATSGCSVLRSLKLSPEYLFIFCKTDFFIKNLIRANTATMYPAVSNDDILNTPILIPSDNLIKKVSLLVREGINNFDASIKIYAQAEDILLNELGLKKWQPNNQLSFVKRYSDTKNPNRIDAEYFQPKYEYIVEAIKGYSGGFDTLKNLVTLNKSLEVGSEEYKDEGVPFIRVSNISPFEITEEKYISKNLYQEILIKNIRI